MKRLFLLLALALPLACQHNAQHSELAAGSWDAQVRNQLNSLNHHNLSNNISNHHNHNSSSNNQVIQHQLNLHQIQL